MTESEKRIPPFGLRLPNDLKERVKAAAEANNRSMNAEIVATLEAEYPPPSDFDLTEFITRWAPQFKGVTDRKEINRLLALANQELNASESGWELDAPIGEDRVSFRIRFGSDKASNPVL